MDAQRLRGLDSSPASGVAARHGRRTRGRRCGAAAYRVAPPAPAGRVPAAAQGGDALFRELDAKIEAAMARYHIPGVAVGVYYQGQEYVRGYGVTNVDYPQPVDGDTLFRIGSTTKTFTGTTVMRLVEQGLLDLDAPVRTYLPDLRWPTSPWRRG